MSAIPPFSEERFPLPPGLGARVSAERRTEIVSLASGREQRNARWAGGRRRYDVGPGIRSVADLAAVIAFFEERRGRLQGFRFRDPLDHGSGAHGVAPAAIDQMIGNGDGTRATFPLVKRYGAGASAYVRPITKPVTGSLRIAVAGAERTLGLHFDADTTRGEITFRSGHVPASGANVTAGFLFDVPVRFDNDTIDVNLSRFRAGEIPTIPLIEIMA